MDYQTAMSAVENDGQFAARLAWPTNKYVGWFNNDLYVYESSGPGAPFTPTTEDLAAQDWIKGGDRPPHRP